MNENQDNQVVLEAAQEVEQSNEPTARERLAEMIPMGSVGVLVLATPHMGETQGINISMNSFMLDASPLLEVFLERFLSDRLRGMADDLNQDLQDCIRASEIGEDIVRRSIGDDAYNALQMMLAVKQLPQEEAQESEIQSQQEEHSEEIEQ